MLNKSIVLSVLGLFFLVVGIGVGVFWWAVSPVSPNAPTQEVIIPKGASVIKIGSILEEKGLIKHQLVFRIVARVTNLDSKLQAGTFELSASMTPQELAQRMTEGSEDTWITLLEGWRREEMADYLEVQDLSAFDKQLFLERTATLEGKLYPDTYLVPKETETLTLISLLTNTYQSKVASPLSTNFQASSLTEREVLTLASLVEREAQGYEQMRHVAGILHNRLDIGMPLQVDASLQYIKGFNVTTGSWWTPPLAADKQLTSTYNTYQNLGLPPAPIANPGVDAIKAVLDPLEVNDLFYLHAPDGTFHYAQTLEEHNANVNTYLR